jgi:Tfp pilus assembly protein PilF
MSIFLKYNFIILTVILFAVQINAQVDDFCTESGNMPSLDSPFSHVPYVFGKISYLGLQSNEKQPNVTISLVRGQQPTERIIVGRSGNYCFKLRTTGGTLIIEVNGTEVTRRTLPVVNGQFREDFEIHSPQSDTTAPPGVISAKFSYPVNPKTSELYIKTSEAENENKSKEAIKLLQEIVSIDPKDFVAWAKLGTIHQKNKSYNEAIAAFKKSLELKIEYTPAWINVAMIRLEQKEYVAAIEVLKQAAVFDSNSARIQQLLGEAYLLTRQGNLGAEALNQAIKLDPIGMAECHLKLAHLYQLANANKLATREYKIFLTKVPDHPDKKKFEKFIKKYPEN